MRHRRAHLPLGQRAAPAAIRATAARRGHAVPTVLAIVGALLLTAAAACSSEGPTHYRNDDYHFTLTVSERFEERSSDARPANGAFAVSFADRDGARVGNRYVDGLVVAVIDVGRDLDEQTARELQQQLTQLAPMVARSLGGEGSTLPGQTVEINSLPGVVIPYAANVNGSTIVGRDYLLVKGRYVYALVIMSASDHWRENEAALEAAVHSFRVE